MTSWNLTLPHLLTYEMEKITPYRFLRVPTLSKPLCSGAECGEGCKERERGAAASRGRQTYFFNIIAQNITRGSGGRVRQ